MVKKIQRNYPRNHRKIYTTAEKALLRYFASMCKTKQDMYNQASQWANQLGRTLIAICKQIEEIKKAQGHFEFFWAKR